MIVPAHRRLLHPAAKLARHHPLAIALLLLTTACSPDVLVGSSALPPNVADPATIKNPAGALGAYRDALILFRTAFGGGLGNGSGDAIVVSGVLSDELQAGSVGAPPGSDASLSSEMALDSRMLPEYQDPAIEGAPEYERLYSALQQVRGQASEARGLLRVYGGDSARALIGQLYAVEGYSELFLADIFCSGIPLSTLDYDGDYTYQAGSTTAAVYQDAVSRFDSAAALATDSARIVGLAQLGAARALLALGRYTEAAQLVANIPDGFQYVESYADPSVAQATATNFAVVYSLWPFTVADREGINGLDFRSSGDPRTAASALGSNEFGVTLYHPDKYASDGSGSIVLADWVEARLIEAEAALQAGDVTTWLAKLNHLRETAITPALPDTTDPEDPNARVDLTFRERAFWLFLTGHRQGDLRRLVRQYGRTSDRVYPIGAYPGGPGIYGSAINAPIPAIERQLNSRFTGCINRGS